MIAVGLGPAGVEPYLENLHDQVKIAAVNSPASATLSGEPEAVEKLADMFDADKVFNRVLKTGDNAYHSHHMLALGEQYEDLASRCLRDIEAITSKEPAGASIRMVSSVVPDKETPQFGPSYWRKNLESPVLFSQAVASLARSVPIDLMIEIGPHPALSGPLKQIRAEVEQSGGKLPQCLASLQRGEHDIVSILKLAGNLYLQNAAINLVAVNSTEHVYHGAIHLEHGRQCVGMPPYQHTYPEKPLYYEGRPYREYKSRKHLRHDLLGARLPGASKTNPSWRNILRIKDIPWLEDHKLNQNPVFPATGYVAMAIEAARQLHQDAWDSAPAKSFNLRQVSILSPLRLVDGELGAETVLSMEKVVLTNTNLTSSWYKFSISSVNAEGDAWTEHCSGTIAAESADTTIDDDLQLHGDSRSRQLSMKRWYDKFKNIGLDYGPCFQGLSNLQAYRGTNIASSQVVLDPTKDKVKGGESEYLVHPATLDTCLQLALISSHAGQVESAKKAFVPVLIDEMTIWVPEQSESVGYALAGGNLLGSRSLYAKVQLFTKSGAPLLDIQEVKCLAFEGAEIADSNMVREPYWRTVLRPDIDTLTNAHAKDLLPPTNLSSSKLEAVDDFFTTSLLKARLDLGNVNGNGDKSENHDAFSAWIRSFSSTSPSAHPSMAYNEELRDIPEARCVKLLTDSIHDILSGKTTSLELLMQDNLLHQLSSSGLLVQGGHDQLCNIVDLLAHKNPRMSILELDAGTGGATKAILDVLGSKSAFKRFNNLTVTDARQIFVADAKMSLAEYDGVSFEKLDIQKDPMTQGFHASSFDLIIAAGNISQVDYTESTLRYMHSLLKPNGKLALLQTTRPRLCSEVIARTLSGKWDDSTLFQSETVWSHLLQKSGFSGIDISLDDVGYRSHEQVCSLILTPFSTTSFKQFLPS